MRVLFFLILSCILASCEHDNTASIIEKTIRTFENNLQLYPNNTWIRTLRRSTKEQEYQMKVDGRAGYAIFKTYPEIQIFRNFTSDSIGIDFVAQFGELNEKDDVAVLLLEKYSEKVKIELRVAKKVIFFFKNHNNQLESISPKNSIIEYDKEWSYFIRDYVAEG